MQFCSNYRKAKRMKYVYKNTSNSIVRIEDIDIKFYPAGKMGDIVDLEKHVPIQKIERSVDLDKMVKKGVLISLRKAGGKAVPTKPLPVPAAKPGPSYNHGAKGFMTYRPKPKIELTQDQKMTGKMVTVYDPVSKTLLHPSGKKVAGQQQTQLLVPPADKVMPAVVSSSEDGPKRVVMVPPAQQAPVVKAPLAAAPAMEARYDEESKCVIMTPVSAPKTQQSSVTASAVLEKEEAEIPESFCSQTMKNNKKCKRKAKPGTDFCYLHTPLE